MSNLNQYEEPTRVAELASDLEDGPPYIVRGYAIGPGDVTHGKSGDRKKWPEAVLRESAGSLAGKNIVTAHQNDPYGVVGEVTETRYEDDKGVFYKGELDDEELAEKVKNGRLDVSARLLHREPEELEKDDDAQAFLIDKAKFDNISLVTKPGASTSNSIELGSAAAMSEGELAGVFEGQEEETVDETSESEGSESDDGEESEEEGSSEEGEELTESYTLRHLAELQNKPTDDTKLDIMQTISISADAFEDDSDVEELSEPVVVEQGELDNLRANAEEGERDYDELRETIDNLSDSQEKVEELENEVEELREKAEAVDEVKSSYAEELAEEGLLDAEDYMDMEVATLREKASDLEAEEELNEDDNPNPKGDNLTEEELNESETVEDEVEEEVAELREEKEWFEEQGWEENARNTQQKIEELTE